jgi:hypothetical protein
MKLNEQEIKSVSSLEPFKRYQYLIKRVADSEKIYTLESDEGNWASSTTSGHHLFPIWSAREYATNSAIDAWSNFKVVEEDLDDFLEITLPKIQVQGLLLNVFPVDEKTGFVVNTIEFVRDIEDELKNYE